MNIHDRTSLRTMCLAIALCAAAAYMSPLQAQPASGGAGDRPSSSSPAPRSGSGSSGSSTTMPGSSGAQSSSPSTSQSRTGAVESEDREFVEKAAMKGMEEVRLSQLAAQRATNSEVRSFAQQLITDHQQANTELASLAQNKGIQVAALTQMSSDTGSRTRVGAPAGGPSSSTGRTGPGETTTQQRSTSPTTSGSSSSSSGSATASSGRTSASSSSDAMDRMNSELEEQVRELSGKQGAEFDQAYIEHMVEGHEEAIELFRDTARREDADREIVAYANKMLPKLQEHHRRAQELERTLDR